MGHFRRKSTVNSWRADGTRRFAAEPADAEYDDLLIDFAGENWTENTNGDAPHCLAKKTARYRFDGREFKLAEGENIVARASERWSGAVRRQRPVSTSSGCRTARCG